MEKLCVFFEIRNQFLNNIYMAFGLNLMTAHEYIRSSTSPRVLHHATRKVKMRKDEG
jgi:hypothetical protein